MCNLSNSHRIAYRYAQTMHLLRNNITFYNNVWYCNTIIVLYLHWQTDKQKGEPCKCVIFLIKRPNICNATNIIISNTMWYAWTFQSMLCMYNTCCIIACNSRSRFNTRITVSHHSDRLEGPIKNKKNYIKLVLCWLLYLYTYIFVWVTIMYIDVMKIAKFLHLNSLHDMCSRFSFKSPCER